MSETTTPKVSTRPDLAAVLAPHWRTDCSDAPNARDYFRWVKCRCGWESERSSTLINAPDMHAVWNAHLAAALNAAIDAWLADEGTRERMWEAVAAVRDASPRTTDDADSWDVLDAALAALTNPTTTEPEEGKR